MKSKNTSFFESELPLFVGLNGQAGLTAPNGRRGTGSETTDTNLLDGYQHPHRACVYGVATRWASTGMFAIRTFVCRLTGASKAGRCVIRLQADSHRQVKGYGFMEMTMVKEDGSHFVMVMNARDARSMAQTLNAAANSCNAMWRKRNII
jgi:hypothetical protein